MSQLNRLRRQMALDRAAEAMATTQQNVTMGFSPEDGHVPCGEAAIVSQPTPERPSAPLVVSVPCACGDVSCSFLSRAVYAPEWMRVRS